MKETIKREKIGAGQGNNKNQRRALLGAISGAGVVGATKLPGQWTRPVVDHVLLPAHAATTDDTGSSPTGGTTSTFITTVTSNCVVTCTSAYALIVRPTAVDPSATWSVYSSSAFYGYQLCSASDGGVTSTYTSTIGFGSGTFSSAYSSSTFYCGPTTVTTSNAICNVTVTSS